MKMKYIGVNVENELREQIEKCAAEHEQTISQATRYLIKKGLEAVYGKKR